MNDAVAALEAALSELRQIEGALPTDLDEEVQDVIRRGIGVLDALRSDGAQSVA